jgi:hypothetical protein
MDSVLSLFMHLCNVNRRCACAVKKMLIETNLTFDILLCFLFHHLKSSVGRWQFQCSTSINAAKIHSGINVSSLTTENRSIKRCTFS